MRGPGQSPFAQIDRNAGTRFSLRFLLLLMIVFSCAAAGLGYAVRIPAISEELNAWYGQTSDGKGNSGRTAQVLFVFFVYSMPLFMAMLIWSLSIILGWLKRFRSESDAESED